MNDFIGGVRLNPIVVLNRLNELSGNVALVFVISAYRLPVKWCATIGARCARPIHTCGENLCTYIPGEAGLYSNEIFSRSCQTEVGWSTGSLSDLTLSIRFGPTVNTTHQTSYVNLKCVPSLWLGFVSSPGLVRTLGFPAFP